MPDPRTSCSLALRLAVGLAVGLVAAGCGSSATDPPNASGNLASPASSVGPGASADTHVAPELERLLPSEIDRLPLSKASTTGIGVFGDDAWSREMTAFLTDRGRTPADLRFALAWDASTTLSLDLGVFQLPGIVPADLRAAIVASTLPNAPGLTSVPTTVAGRPITLVTYPNGARLYLIEGAEVVFWVGADDPDLAARLVALLP
jgi:hypothetical protein